MVKIPLISSPIIRWLASGLALILGILLIAIILYRFQSLPKTSGELNVGIQAEASIARDSDGVPTIKAASLNDAWFAMGFAHAQDRLWQLEMQRRIAAGRLSEVLGKATLDTDKFLRTLGVRRSAAIQLQKLDETTQQALQHYAKGVNAGIAQTTGKGILPPEFLMLGVKPEPWEPVDSVAWWLMMSWDLGSNWTQELIRMQLAQKLTVDQINQVLPLLSNPPSPIRDYTVLYKSLGLATAMADTKELLAMMPHVGMDGIGSNNWVVHGSRTASGKPLLANDPHLSLQAPSLWYMAKLDAGGYQLSGGTLPGIPFFPLGRNQFVAWGATNTGSDVQDLYIERFNPADPNSVLGPQGLEPTQLVLETIKIKGEKDLPLNVRYTRRGPLISDVHDGVKKALGGSGFGMSLRWTALDVDNLTVQAGMRLNLAKSAAEVQTALKDYAAPTQNIVFADTQGNIGWLTVGNEPIRSAAHDLHGLAPAPAWEAKYQWQGYVPFEQWPSEFNPDRAYIATANNNILPEGYPFFIGAEWTLPFRAQRAAQLIEAAPKHDVNSMKAMHADVQSLAFASFMRSVQAGGALVPSTELGKEALALLGKFDGVMSAIRAEPLIATAWQLQLSRAIFADEVGAEAYEKLMSRRDGFGAVLLATATQSTMCDNINTPAVETCNQIASKALDDACAQLAASYGSNISKWQWGQAHIARSDHRPFGKQPLLAKLFDLRAATSGDTYTLNVGRMANTGDAPFTNVHAASLRAVYDMASPQAAWLMQSTGQSGHRLSSHYSDLMDRWVAVQYLDMTASKPDQVLRLLP